MYQLVIVDDEERIAEGIANLFPWESVGFQAISFSRAKDALSYAEIHHVDVIMSDIEMPDMDGIELCRRLKDQEVKIIFLSSHQNYEHFRYAIQFRVEDYLLKPLKSGDVLTCFGKIKEELDQKYQVGEERSASYYEKIIETVQKYPISLALRMSLDAESVVQWGKVMAMAAVAVIPVILLFFAAQRYFVEGIATSGLKG